MRITQTGLAPAQERNLPIFDHTTSQLDPNAAKAIEILSRGNHIPDSDVEVVRRQYAINRAPHRGEIEDVAKVFRVQGSGGNIPAMTVLRPHNAPSEQTLLPALVYLHGGGWTLGGFDTYEPLCRQLANATGRVVISVDYRLAPEHPFPAALEDTWNAIEWVAANSTWIGVDKSRIAIGGDSAGGNLAAVTAIAARDGLVGVTPEFQLLIYPCLDMTASQPSHDQLARGYLLTRELYAWYRRNYIGDFPDLMDWHLSPLAVDYVGELSPAIILYAGFDPLRDEAVAYSSRLLNAGVPVEPIFFPNMIHGFMTLGGLIPAAAVAVRRIALAIKALERAGTAPRSAIRPATTRENCVQPPHSRLSKL
jgi:acetyl esterase